MTLPTKVTFEFNVAGVEALNSIYDEVNQLRDKHQGIHIAISSKQTEIDDHPFVSMITIAAITTASLTRDIAKEIMHTANEITSILPGESLC